MAPPYFLFKEVMTPAGKPFLRGLGQKSTIRYVVFIEDPFLGPLS
jgi:hypothetical protein